MSDYKLAIKIAGELDSSLSESVKEAQGYLDELNGNGGGGAGEAILGGLATGAKTVAKASLESLMLIGKGAAKVGKDSVEVGMDFESAMAALASTAGIEKTSDAYAMMEEAARHVGSTTNKTSTEAANALQYMALAGWGTVDSVDALEDMVKLSSATNTDLARTSDLVTDSMGALGLGMQDYAGYMDMVARADSAANYSGTEFMETMIGAGGAARMLGIDVTELGTAAGILANNGTKGSEAGTKLNSIFARMAGQSKPVQEALADLGTTITDDSGNFLSMEEMLGNIKTGLEGISEESERARIMKDLFGTHNLSEAQYLLDSVGEGGGWDGLEQNLVNAQQGVDEFGNSVDTLDQKYHTMTDTLQGDLDILKSSYASLGEEIYKNIVGDEGTGLRGAVQQMTDYVQQMKDAFSTDGAEGIATALGNMIGDISDKITTDGAQVITDAQQFASDLVSAIGSEETSTSIGTAASTIISSLATSFLKYTGDFTVAAGNILQGLITALGEEDVGTKIGEAASSMITKIGTWFQENKDSFGPAAGNLISSLVSGIASNSGEILSGGIAIVEGLAEGVVQAGFILISHAPQIVYDLAMGVLEGIDSLFDAGLALGAALLDGIMNIGESIKQWWSDMWDLSQLDLAPDVSGYFVEHTEEINAAVQEMASTNSSWQDLSDTSKAYFEQLANGSITLQQAETDLANYNEAVGMSFEDASGNMQTFMSGSELETALYTYKTLVTEASEAAIAANQEAAEVTQETSVEMAQGISAETQAMVDSIKESGDGVTDSASSMASEFEALKNEVSSSASEMQEAVDLNLADSMGTEAMGTLVDSAATGQISEISAQINEAMQSIQTSVATAALAVSASFAGMVAAVGISNAAVLLSCGITAAGISSAFSGIDLSGIAQSMMAGLTNGIKAGGAMAIAAAQSVASQIASIMASTVKVGSPSRVTYEIGSFIGEGLENGIADSQPGVYSASEALANSAVGGQTDALSSPLRAFNEMASPSAQSATESDGGGGIIFSPQITIAGNASESDVRNALSWSMAEFERMYDRLIKDRRRTSFA